MVEGAEEEIDGGMGEEGFNQGGVGGTDVFSFYTYDDRYIIFVLLP